jgi:serine/threonine protein kinase
MEEAEFFKRFTYDPKNDVIGSGGFGTVYRAFDTKEKRFVALKIAQVKDCHGKFTLLNEVDLSRQIDHHVNVARYDFGFRAIHPFQVDYAVMDYYEEGNLDAFLRTLKRSLSEKENRDLIEGILEGISHLHQEDVIHRDLKSANILIHRTKQGTLRPKIADFGLSRAVESGSDKSYSNSALGLSIAYAAPEQIQNKSIRKNVDLWAFGVIVYRIWTGELPFKAAPNADSTRANLEISEKIISAPFPERLKTIPEPYQTIILRCWERDAEHRVQSSQELLELLKQNPIAEISKARKTVLTPAAKPQSNTVPTKIRLNAILRFVTLLILGGVGWYFFSKQDTHGMAQSDNAVLTAFQKAQNQQTITAWKSFLNKFPNSAQQEYAGKQADSLKRKKEIYLKDAAIMSESGEPAAALELYQKALSVQPDDVALQTKIHTIKQTISLK